MRRIASTFSCDIAYEYLALALDPLTLFEQAGFRATPRGKAATDGRANLRSRSRGGRSEAESMPVLRAAFPAFPRGAARTLGRLMPVDQDFNPIVLSERDECDPEEEQDGDG